MKAECVQRCSDNYCKYNMELERVCEQVREVIACRDRCVKGSLGREECEIIINYLCRVTRVSC